MCTFEFAFYDERKISLYDESRMFQPYYFEWIENKKISFYNWFFQKGCVSYFQDLQIL